MKPLLTSAILIAILTAAVLTAAAPQASAQDPPPGQPVLLCTLGACDNAVQGGPCTHRSTLVQIDPGTGALVRTTDILAESVATIKLLESMPDNPCRHGCGAQSSMT